MLLGLQCPAPVPPAQVAEDEGEGGQPDGRVDRHALPEGGVEHGAAHPLHHGLQEAVGPRIVLAALLEAGQDSTQEAIEAGCEAGAKRHEVGLIHCQQRGADIESSVGQQGEQASGVDEQLGAEPVGPHALEDDVVGLECLLVDAGREVGMHALSESLADKDPPGDDGVLHVGQQHPVQLGQCRDEVRPL